MTDTIREQSDVKSFVLLSAALREVYAQMRAAQSPVFRLWYHRNAGEFSWETGIYDELEIFDAVSSLLSDTEVFFTLPDCVRHLSEAHKAACADRTAYLRCALALQKKRLARIENGFSRGDCEKRRRNIERGIERVQRAAGEKIAPAIERLMRDTVEEMVRGKRQIAGRIEETRDGKTYLIVGKDIFEGAARQEAERLHANLGVLEERKTTLQSELETLLAQSRMQKEISAIQERTEAALRELGVLAAHATAAAAQSARAPAAQSESSAANAAPNNAHANGETSSASIARGRKHPKNGEGEQTRDRGHDSGREEESSREHADEKDAAIQQLREAISRAASSTNKIRILSSQKTAVRRRFFPAWQELFMALGFRGTIECVRYEDLNRSKDLTSVVIVPRSMNTHSTIWNRRRYAGVVVLNYSNSLHLLTHLRGKTRAR